MAERLGETNSQVLSGHAGQREAPLEPVGAVGRTLDHLLKLIPVEAEDIGVRLRRLLERRAQPREERVASTFGDLSRRVLERVGQRGPSSSSVLMRFKNLAARSPYKIR